MYPIGVGHQSYYCSDAKAC